MQTKPIPTIAVVPEEILSLSEKIEKWVWRYCRTLEENYELRYPNSSDPITFSMELGRKYWKVKQNGGGVHSFVDRNTGQVYKPASYKSPAKHVRYDLRIINNRQQLHNPNFTDWAGGYLYLR